MCLFLMQPPHITVLVCCLCVETERKREGRRGGGYIKRKTNRDRNRMGNRFLSGKQKETKTETNTPREKEEDGDREKERET